jgi:predicted nucleic acid-binding protein
VLRGLLGTEDAAAQAWIEAAVEGRVEALAPELVFAEVANALAVSTRGRKIAAAEARDALRATIALPLRVISLGVLSMPALERALTQRISAYDACYLELAEAAGATLVTADRHLARAAPRKALLPHDGPPG